MRWMDNMEEWTGMPFEDLWKKTRDRRKWSRLVHEASHSMSLSEALPTTTIDTVSEITRRLAETL